MRDYEYENAWKWMNPEWLDLHHNGCDKNKFQYCLHSDGLILYMRAIQGHSGATKVDPSLLDDVLIPYKWSECFYHVGSSLCIHSIFHSGLLAGGKDTKGRQTVFFTALDYMSNVQKEEHQDVSKPRKVHYKNKRKCSRMPFVGSI